jgi:hypothetical protein
LRLGKEDVLRIEIAVNEAALMRFVELDGNLPQNCQLKRLRRERSPLQHLLQRDIAHPEFPRFTAFTSSV